MPRGRSGRLLWSATAATALLVVAAFVVPHLTGWEVNSRAPRSSVDELITPPLHGWFEPKLGPGTPFALLVAAVGLTWLPRLAESAPWRRLLLVSYAGSLAWLLSLALVDGVSGLTRVLGSDVEYLPTARDVADSGDVGGFLDSFISRIGYDAPDLDGDGDGDNWPTHVAGHPPLMTLLFVGLARVGLGGDLAAALVVVAIAATLPAAVLVTMRALRAETPARQVAAYLVLSPAAVFLAVSADAVIAVVVAWGLAALALSAAAVRDGTGTGRWVAWAVVAGLLLGSSVFLSYGMPLMGLAALAVLASARAWRPFWVTAGAALVVAGGFALVGFAWWEAYPVLTERYWDGIAEIRPAAYWMWGNLAALVLITGPVVGASLLSTWRRLPDLRHGRLDDATRAVVLLVVAVSVVVLTADLSRMSKSEVERIWLPFAPWLTISAVLLPERWRRGGLVAAVATGLLVQHLLYTSW